LQKGAGARRTLFLGANLFMAAIILHIQRDGTTVFDRANMKKTLLKEHQKTMTRDELLDLMVADGEVVQNADCAGLDLSGADLSGGHLRAHEFLRGREPARRAGSTKAPSPIAISASADLGGRAHAPGQHRWTARCRAPSSTDGYLATSQASCACDLTGADFSRGQHGAWPS
jgi:uncharacterized protein YjbI with pentapeptide repeats